MASHKNEYFRMFNHYYFHVILHEVSHAYQGLIIQNKIPVDPIIYKIESFILENFIYSRNYIEEKIKDFHYKRDGIRYSFEINANIYALQNLYKIYESEKMKKFCLTSIFDYYLLGYISKETKIISPVEYTFKKLFCNMDLSPCQNIPFIERLERGYPISREEYNQVYDLIERPFKTLEECENTMNKLQRIR